MIFLPIVEREMRAASRRRGTYWMRTQIALSGLIPVLFILVGPAGFMSPAQQGSEMFQFLSYLAFFFTIVSAVRLTADCISSEKREGTLGLLFLTDLKPYDVVLGKLSATSLNAFYGLVALLPVLAIPLMLGGVTFGDLARLTMVLLNTLFFALAVSMFVSVLSWHERKAVGVTTVLLMGFCAGLPFVTNVATQVNGSGGMAQIIAYASPGYACTQIRSAAFAGGADRFWISTIATHLLGWLFFWLSCRMLPRAWQDRPSEGLLQRWRNWCRDLVMGNRTSRAVFRRAALDVNPMFWLASRERRMVWYPWILLGSLAIITMVSCSLLKVRGVDYGPLWVSAFFLNWFFNHWIINIACQAFAEDRDKGALELLLSTPLRIQEVIAGHARALRRQFLAPVLVMMVVETGLFVVAAFTADHRGDAWTFGFVMLAMQIVFMADVVAAAWVGWWSSVVAKSASSAVTSTYVKLMIGPWFFVGTFMLVAYLLSDVLSLWIVGKVPVVAWILFSLAADVIFGWHARRSLLTQLRLSAVERYGGGDPAMVGWRRLGRWLGRWWSGAWRSSPSPNAV